jgi:transaldolase/glucose-6-phosphate isomerase
LGKAALANAKIAYSKFKEIFSGPRWQVLKAKGAQVQRCLWASIPPNPDYPDVKYLGPLIGPSTVSTMALRALDNYGDRGRIVPTLEDGLDEAHETILGLAEAGIDLKAVTERLQARAIEALGDAFEGAVEAIDSRVQVVW